MRKTRSQTQAENGTAKSSGGRQSSQVSSSTNTKAAATAESSRAASEAIRLPTATIHPRVMVTKTYPSLKANSLPPTSSQIKDYINHPFQEFASARRFPILTECTQCEQLNFITSYSQWPKFDRVLEMRLGTDLHKTYTHPMELHAMIISFRIADLQKILGELNVSVVGRKSELQKKLTDSLKNNYALIEPKIRDLFHSTIKHSLAVSTDKSDLNGPPQSKRMYQPQLNLPVQPGGTMVGNNIVLSPFTNNMNQACPILPDVRLKKLAFYDIKATLLQPSSLMAQNSSRVQEASFYFTLTPQQATEIASNRDIRNGSKIEHTVQVQLRFCLLETSCEQEDCFPPNVIVKVNNKLCPLPNPIPTNRPNVEPKRPPRPVNVTTNVKLSPLVTNNITVQWCPDYTRGYVIAAYLVRKLSSSELLQRMKVKGVKPVDYTRALIKEKLTEDADCEIATTMLKVSLICPLGKMKMSIPCRSSTCSHLQCFDASLYLQMNERKPTWNCPVCDKPAIYDNLVIDGYFQEVLVSQNLSSEDTEIQLHKDGSWSTQIMKLETQAIDTPRKPQQKVEVISDDLEVITADTDKKTLSKSNITMPAVPPPPSMSNEPTSTTNSETVDLTLSDSDDDVPLKRRMPGLKIANNVKSAAAQSTNKAKSDIISLDSPSPPSSPVAGGQKSSDVTSTTTPTYPLSIEDELIPPNFILNPMALRR